ncbi:unnamed protein product [Rhizoctonia solani]|uniref:Uncharacterized protein n=1 Tax=Rhizoctonia solani TaxID=456999 RepID=A0A8H2WPX2_9AGAM|nr:unnamed protein product [Rhizoctonia solani]CAE6394777.1 unnamed protein product [Rhizoctonia solani]
MSSHHEGQHTLTASDLDRAVEENVANLGNSILETKNYFDKISTKLRELSSILKPPPSWLEWLGLTSRLGAWEPITEWTSISNDYDALVRESKKLATTIACRVKYFREDIIPSLIDQNRSLSNKKYQLENFIKETDEIEYKANALSEGFSMIPRRINRFHQFWREQFSDSNDSTNNQVKKLVERIDDLRTKIENNERERHEAWRSFSSVTPGVASELTRDNIVLAALDMLGEEILVLLLKVIFGVNVVITEGQTCVRGFWRELVDKSEECKELQLKGTDLKYFIEGYLNIHELCTEEVCNRLKGIANIWASVGIC